jgi:hypothetical protein
MRALELNIRPLYAPLTVRELALPEEHGGGACYSLASSQAPEFVCSMLSLDDNVRAAHGFYSAVPPITLVDS